MKKKIYSLVVLGALLTAGTLQCFASGFEGESSRWKTFEKISFQVDGRAGHVVLPETPAEGNPWVWRARFPNWHTEVDLLLLEKGYSIGYIDVTKLFGSPTAVAHWDAFYAFMVSKGMSEKAVLEGVSRGGLICFNWAKKNPEKVACMYLEAPVCDIKSWPGGKGTGKGAANEWGQAQQIYGFDEAGLMEWNDNPIDNLGALAAAKIPIYAAINLKDIIVPPEENSLELMRRYIALGGPFTVYPMTLGEQKADGHHFTIERPDRIVDFIVTHTTSTKP
ncbi:alpha/beta hydrolase family protein [Pontiella sulfatireligans]|uniref:Peptidase S9 prolyl oligopeptidase catalytic domain-containing protein n=1 Tax=Pontiella sulfatireligans TaxID=2750658 RepID=A0A6C2UFE9_9BACT|nr:alpha/beta hydrolase [Pontiella sulfatireligans]VGO18603.1 hypothetical protein SCARR_00656 [Pontiella sulfatireligans]